MQFTRKQLLRLKDMLESTSLPAENIDGKIFSIINKEIKDTSPRKCFRLIYEPQENGDWHIKMPTSNFRKLDLDQIAEIVAKVAGRMDLDAKAVVYRGAEHNQDLRQTTMTITRSVRLTAKEKKQEAVSEALNKVEMPDSARALLLEMGLIK